MLGYPTIPSGFLPSTVEEITPGNFDSCLRWIERTFLNRSFKLVQGDNKKLIELLGFSKADYYRRKKALDFEKENEAHL